MLRTPCFESIQAVQQSQPPNAKDARAALDSGEFDKAATLAAQILDADPQNVIALRIASWPKVRGAGTSLSSSF